MRRANSYADSRRRAKVSALVEALGFLPAVPNADDVTTWSGDQWDRLTEFANGLLETDERKFCPPSEESRRMVVEALRRQERIAS